MLYNNSTRLPRLIISGGRIRWGPGGPGRRSVLHMTGKLGETSHRIMQKSRQHDHIIWCGARSPSSRMRCATNEDEHREVCDASRCPSARARNAPRCLLLGHFSTSHNMAYDAAERGLPILQPGWFLKVWASKPSGGVPPFSLHSPPDRDSVHGKHTMVQLRTSALLWPKPEKYYTTRIEWRDTSLGGE